MKTIVVFGALALATLSWAQSKDAASQDTGAGLSHSPASLGNQPTSKTTSLSEDGHSSGDARFRLVSHDGGVVAFSGNGTGLASDTSGDRWLDSIEKLSSLVAGQPITSPLRKDGAQPAKKGWPIQNIGTRSTTLPALLITAAFGFTAFGLIRMRRK